LPKKKHKLVVAWIEIHQEDLMADWHLAVTGSKLFTIRRFGSMIIEKVFPQDDFTLHVESEYGISGTFDVKPYLDSEIFEPLKNPDEFRKIRNGKYFVEWQCGADLSADTIEVHLTR
jgi:hypothetical protein